MKKLIVLSVVFALVATAAFAVDLGANVFGLTVPASGTSGDLSKSDDITASTGFQRVRLSGSGEAGDGAFGGWIRAGDNLGGIDFKAAYAYWKPIDQLKVLIGGNNDGMYGKEGVTGWGFNGNPYDAGVAYGGGKIWGGVGYNNTREVFYGGYDDVKSLHLNITPVDMLAINVALPLNGKTEDAFKNVMAQVDVNLDFGNIALTYLAVPDAGNVYIYYGGSFGDLGLDVGFSYDMNDGNKLPIGIGAGVKFATDAFGVKFRTAVTLGDGGTAILADLLPYFSLGDNVAAFVNLGLSMAMPDGGDTQMDWLLNPYVRIGEEWGAQFLVGFDVHSEKNGKLIAWGIPIAIMVNF